MSQGPGSQRRSGHVLRVNGKARTAVVHWDPSSAGGETLQEQEVSCYALRVRSRPKMGAVSFSHVIERTLYGAKRKPH